MSIREFQPSRAVEVIVTRDNDKDDYGSGYRIGGRLVLTTAHLLNPVGSSCYIRDKRSFGKETARVVWKVQDLDIALVELPENLKEIEPIVFGKLPEGKRGEKIEFSMYSYPAWARTQRNYGKAAAGGRQVEGIIYLSDTSADELIVLESLRSPEGKRENRSDWGGSSGAAIICDGLVVAVLKQHQNPERPASLEAVPLWKVYDNEQWKKLLTRHGIKPESKITRLDFAKSVDFNPPYIVPLRGTEHFVGRQDVLSQLQDYLQSSGRVAITALSGMGGIGKTELAVQYARCKYYERYYSGGVCWFHSTENDISIQFKELAVQLSLNLPDGLNSKQIACLFWQLWQPSEGEVLVIFDDVINFESIEPFLPKDNRFKLLLTTRVQKLGTSIRTINLNVLNSGDALELLTKQIGSPNRVEEEISASNELCEWLGYLPLGIELVGRYLWRYDFFCITDVLDELKAVRLNQESLKVRDTDITTEHSSLAAAFELSWQELSHANRHLACLLGLFASAPFTWSMIKGCLPEYTQRQLEDALVNMSLLKHISRNVYQLHQLIREFFIAKLECSNLKSELIKSFCQTMLTYAVAVPQFPNATDLETFGFATLHFEEILEHHVNRLTPEHLYCLCGGLGRFYEGYGHYERAIKCRKKSLDVTKNSLGEDHFYTSSSIQNLAFLYDRLGQYRKAEPLYLEALENRRRTLSRNSLAISTTLDNLANLYVHLGYYEKAAPLFEEALLIRRFHYKNGAKDSFLYETLHNKAQLLSSQGNYEEAKILNKESLEMLEEEFDDSHESLVLTLGEIAGLHTYTGQFEQARAYFTRAKKIAFNKLGENHPTTLEILHGEGNFYLISNQYSVAEKVLERVLLVRKKLFGNHPKTAESLRSLAQLHVDQFNYEKAESLLKQELEIEQNLLGEHPQIAITQNILAEIFRQLNRFEESESLLLKALKIMDGRLEEHPELAVIINTYGLLKIDQTHFDEAETLLKRAISLDERNLGSESLRVSNKLGNLAELYRLQKRFEEAEPLYQQSLLNAKKFLGNESTEVARILNNIAVLYFDMQSLEKACRYHIESLNIRRKIFGNDHFSVAMSLIHLARVYLNQGNLSKCEDSALQALSNFRRYKSREDTVANSLSLLAELYNSNDKYGDAVIVLEEAIDIRQRIYNDEHPTRLIDLHNIVMIYTNYAVELRDGNQYTKAKLFYKKAIANQKKMLSIYNRNELDPQFNDLLATNLNHLGFIYFSLEDYTSAKQVLEEELKLRKELNDSSSLNLANCLNSMGVLHAKMKQYAISEKYFLKSLMTAISLVGIDHPQCISISESFGNMVAEAVQKNRTIELSRNKLTQLIIQKLR